MVFPCTVEGCSSGGSTSSNLRRHLTNTHGYAYSCSECDDVFQTSRELKDHIVLSHQEMRPTLTNGRYSVKCSGPGCSESFTNREKLAEHCREVHDPTQFKVHNITFKDDATFTVHSFEKYPKSFHYELQAWKGELESVSSSFFSIERTKTSTGTVYYSCSRGNRERRVEGSQKETLSSRAQSHCSAFITVKKRS